MPLCKLLTVEKLHKRNKRVSDMEQYSPVEFIEKVIWKKYWFEKADR